MIRSKEQGSAMAKEKIYCGAVKALKKLQSVAGYETCQRALQDATAAEAESNFAANYGVTRAKSSCIHRLCGRACGYSRQRPCQCNPPGNDHGSMWLKGGKPFMFVSQPYTVGTRALAEATVFAKENKLEIEIRADCGFYAPGVALLIIWRREGWQKEILDSNAHNPEIPLPQD